MLIRSKLCSFAQNYAHLFKIMLICSKLCPFEQNYAHLRKIKLVDKVTLAGWLESMLIGLELSSNLLRFLCFVMQNYARLIAVMLIDLALMSSAHALILLRDAKL